MGGGSWSPSDWTSYKTTKIDPAKTTGGAFKARTVDPGLKSVGIDIRESRDSADHPESTPIIVGLDVTGSMAYVSDKMQRKLGTLMEELLARKPVKDPQLMFMGIGDVWCDKSPLQVTQFESDIRIAEQLEKIYLENGGGGNNFESYNLAWYFGGWHTSTDAFEKRNKKGFLFTIGDDGPPAPLNKEHIKQFVGADVPGDLNNAQLLDKAGQMYNIFHIIVGQGHSYGRDLTTRWNDVLGQKVIHLADWEQIVETIISTIQVVEGATVDDVVSTWSGSTAVAVRNAIKDIVPGAKPGGSSGVVRL